MCVEYCIAVSGVVYRSVAINTQKGSSNSALHFHFSNNNG